MRCAADDFGDVGRDRHHLGLEPEGAAVVLTQALTQHFGQGSAGDETEFRGQILHEDGHRVGEYEYPDEEVAVLGAGGEVGGDVAGSTYAIAATNAGPSRAMDLPVGRRRGVVGSCVLVLIGLLVTRTRTCWFE